MFLYSFLCTSLFFTYLVHFTTLFVWKSRAAQKARRGMKPEKLDQSWI
jgi:nicotinamide riboside transporter PnuC